jgi:hypothetical protein
MRLGIRYVKAPDFLNFRHYEGGKVVTPTHRPSLPPGLSWYSFLVAESTPGHMVTSVASEKILSDTTGDRSRQCQVVRVLKSRIISSLWLLDKEYFVVRDIKYKTLQVVQ